MENHLTIRERLALGAFFLGCLAYGWLSLPSDGVFCAGPTATTGFNDRLEGCDEHRAKYAEGCDIRWPRCAWKRMTKPWNL